MSELASGMSKTPASGSYGEQRGRASGRRPGVLCSQPQGRGAEGRAPHRGLCGASARAGGEHAIPHAPKTEHAHRDVRSL